MKKIIRLTESDLLNLVKRVIKEQEHKFPMDGKPHSVGPGMSPQTPTTTSGCLIKAGFTRDSIGGPMTKRIVYTKDHNGTTYQIGIEGSDKPTAQVRLIKNQNVQVCSWSCDAGSEMGIKIQGCKKEQTTFYEQLGGHEAGPAKPYKENECTQLKKIKSSMNPHQGAISQGFKPEKNTWTQDLSKVVKHTTMYEVNGDGVKALKLISKCSPSKKSVDFVTFVKNANDGMEGSVHNITYIGVD